MSDLSASIVAIVAAVSGLLSGFLLPIAAKLAPGLGQKLIEFFYSAQLVRLNARFQQDLERYKSELAKELEGIRHQYARELENYKQTLAGQREVQSAQRLAVASSAAEAHRRLCDALTSTKDLDAGLDTDVQVAIAKRMLSAFESAFDPVLVKSDTEVRRQFELFLDAYVEADLGRQDDRRKVLHALACLRPLLRELMA